MRKYNGLPNVSGKIIEEYRLKNDMSREDLSKKLQLMGINIDRNNVYRIEKGKVLLKDFELIAFCKILNINYSDLKNLID